MKATLGTRGSIGLLAALAAATLLVPAFAVAGLPKEVQAGHQLATSVRARELRCGSLSGDDFQRIGEFAMARVLRSPTTHRTMNRRMAAMMGSGGEQRMHVALGYRLSGCPGGPTRSSVGAMTWMMARGGSGYGAGMMGGTGPHSVEGMEMDTVVVVAIAVLSALLGGGLAALMGQRRHPDNGRTA